ncbi:CD2-associated protein-like, partial [Mercenaria mercenaria]|uniref:CD2-associated protein-like n=1 Tax=Mercenaria mercenaria TaxID=6596 RepID=UPI00234F461A
SCEGVEFIPHIARGYFKKQDQDKIQTSLEKVKNDLQTLKSKTQNELKELNKQRSDILDDIQDFKKRIIKRVEELEEKSVNEIQNKHKELVDDINASCITIDKKLKDVESQLDKLKCSKSVNEAQTFVDIKHGEKMISYGNDSVNMITARGIATIAFEVNKAIENYVHVTQSLGKLTVKTPTAATEVEVEYSYEAEQSDELTLKVGDIIKNVTICEGGWWEGELDGKRGTFPDNFVKIINAEDKNGREGKRQVCPGCNEKETWQTKYLSDGPPVLRKKKVEVEYSYEAEQSDELTLKVGDIIKNVTICEGGWWEGELDGKRGTFPDNFVKIINAEDKNGREGKRQVCPGCNEKETWQTKYLSDGPPVLRKKKTSLIEKAIVVFSYEAEHEDELTLKVGDIVYILDKKLEDAGWCKGELNGKIGVFPENFVKIS